MNRIFVTGDTHGDYDMGKIFTWYDRMTKLGFTFTREDIVLIAGDFGVIWTYKPDKDEINMITRLNGLPFTIMFIDGNHENHLRLNTFPVIEKYGANCHKITDSIYHIMRGEILKVNNLKILCMGGADSHDKEWRTENISWWSQEIITEKDIENAINNLKEINYEIDFVVSHSLPSSLLKRFIPSFETTQSSDMLEKVATALCKINNSWITGHYHMDEYYNNEEYIDGKIFDITMIYDDIIELVENIDVIENSDYFEKNYSFEVGM